MFVYDDNFLTEEEIQEIEDMFWSLENNWMFHKYTQNNDVKHSGVVNTGRSDIPYFTVGIRDGFEQKQYDLCVKLINKFCEKNGIHYDTLGRVKFNIQPSSQENETLYPHVDKSSPHLVFLYYVCDSDGDTFLYNETFTGEIIEPPLTIMERVTPKRGAAFVVDGKHFHSITPPKDHMLRAVINANLDLRYKKTYL